jgi:hypothetical protein
MNTIYLDVKDVPREWIPADYKGKKFKAVICDKLTVTDCELRWSGGTRTTYTIIENGRQTPVTEAARFPNYGEQVIELRRGRVLRSHTFSCGKDTGLTFYCVADDVNQSRLPAPEFELSGNEWLVLNSTTRYKSQYMGLTRRQMMNQDCAYASPDFKKISTQEWDEIVKKLAGLGLLDKRGAITNRGKNALNQRKS